MFEQLHSAFGPSIAAGPATCFFNDEPDEGDDVEGDGSSEEGGDNTPEANGSNEGDDPAISALQDALDREKARNSRLEDRIEELEGELEAARGDESEQVEELRERIEELEQENERLQTESRQEKIDRALLEKAQKAGIEQTEVAKNLIDRDELELTDDGEVAGVEAELSRLEDQYREQMPGLWGDVPSDDDSERDEDEPTTTSSPDSGGSKPSDRGEGGDEFDSDEEAGAALFEQFNDDSDSQTI
ncbi:MAG: phage scaffolding protein [Bradymonadaceae bacterium]